jgi:hypothetical protein
MVSKSYSCAAVASQETGQPLQKPFKRQFLAHELQGTFSLCHPRSDTFPHPVTEDANQQVPLLYSIVAQLQRDAKATRERPDVMSVSHAVGEESQALDKVRRCNGVCHSLYKRLRHVLISTFLCQYDEPSCAKESSMSFMR